MGYTLDQFAGELHRILAADPGPEGRQKVCKVVQEMCLDKAFAAKYLGDDAPERNILYEDKELGLSDDDPLYQDIGRRLQHIKWEGRGGIWDSMRPPATATGSAWWRHWRT